MRIKKTKRFIHDSGGNKSWYTFSQAHYTCDLINTFYGINNANEAYYESSNTFMIFFKCNDFESLHWITRCVDRRYFKHGGDWNLELTSGDTPDYKNEKYPIRFHLIRKGVNKNTLIGELKALNDNLIYYLTESKFVHCPRLFADDEDEFWETNVIKLVVDNSELF